MTGTRDSSCMSLNHSPMTGGGGVDLVDQIELALHSLAVADLSGRWERGTRRGQVQASSVPGENPGVMADGDVV